MPITGPPTNMCARSPVSSADRAEGALSRAPTFVLNSLTTSVPEKGRSLETYTGTSPMTRPDFEGLLKTIPANVPARSGMRVVTNLVPSPQDLTSQWLVTNGASVVDVNTVTYDGTNDSTLKDNFIPAVGEQYRFQIRARLTAGTPSAADKVLVQIWGAFAAVTAEIGLVLTPEYQTFTTPIATATGTSNSTFQLRADEAVTIDVEWAQLEKVHGQTNQNPSEFVTGTQYFKTLNGNTIAGTVVTEATGTAIAQSIMKGQRDQKGSTNISRYSEDLDNAYWTNSNLTSALQGATGPDGLTSATEMVATAVSIQHHINRATAWTGLVADSAVCYSIFVKAGTLDWVTLFTSSATTGNKLTYFDLANGVVGATDQHTDSGIEALTGINAGWYRCYVIHTLTGGNTALDSIRIMSAEADNDNVFTGNASDVQTLAYGIQLEASTYPTPYIPTTTGTVQRTDTTSAYPTAGVFKENNCWGVVVVSFPFDSTVDNGTWDSIFGSLSGTERLHLYKNAGNGVFTLKKKIGGVSYPTTTADVPFDAGDIIIVGWRINNADGIQIWKRNVTKAEAVIKDATPNSNTGDVTLNTAFGFNKQNDAAAESSLDRRNFETYFGSPPDSVIEARIEQLAALLS